MFTWFISIYNVNEDVGAATITVTLDAVSDQMIDATVFAGSVSLSGGTVGVALSGAGATLGLLAALGISSVMQTEQLELPMRDPSSSWRRQKEQRAAARSAACRSHMKT